MPGKIPHRNSRGAKIVITEYRKRRYYLNRFSLKDIMNNKDELVTTAATLIKLGEKILNTETEASHRKPLVSEKEFHDFRISTLSFFSRVFGDRSDYYQSFKAEVTQATASRTRRGISMLTAASRELQGNWLDTTRGSIVRDTLADMLRLAQDQLNNGNVRAAVVIAGAVLEKLLRNICLEKDIKIHNEIQGKAVPKKALQLTGEAYKKKLYDRQENKQIINWLDLVQKSAAEESAPVSLDQASKLVKGIQNLINKLRF